MLDSEGKRILSKYYSPSDFPGGVKEQRQLEKALFDKSKKTSSKRGRVLLHGGDDNAWWCLRR